MDVPARLKWRKEPERYAAYPVGSIHADRLAWIAPNIARYQSWKWVVSWERWFAESGVADSKQEAADRATEAWWRLVQTDIPRDVDLETSMIVARLLVRPVPNSLFDEDADYLRKVMWALNNVYRTEIIEGVPAIRNLYDQLSAEFARRRETGEIPDQPKGEAISNGYRRRRRR
ncbi:hypothetical protein [uncultured Devosia sp.]|uniref:hypothetical protein n=1 Tax=uncultured Devosia sp. TaxID=211434 RepID=UPI0026223BE1|nr:hypothetical protein [uncultured Devosia sp.]